MNKLTLLLAGSAALALTACVGVGYLYGVVKGL